MKWKGGKSQVQEKNFIVAFYIIKILSIDYSRINIKQIK